MGNELIRVRFTAFLCLVPLAITSTKGWVRRLGEKRWQRLHRLVYGAVLLVLLGSRVWFARQRATARRLPISRSSEAKPAA